MSESYLLERPRRLRRTEGLRTLAAETRLHPADFVLPLFVAAGHGLKREIASLPGVNHYSADTVVAAAKEAWNAGVRAVLLFGVPDQKDALGSSAHSPTGPVAKSIGALKQSLPNLVVMTDVCLCAYTDHGHCGVLADTRDGELGVDNDKTLPVLAETAICHARAGADVVAPSDMMDGRVRFIRHALDEAGFEQVAILSYAAKYASAFYGPFRDAAQSAPSSGDRRGYQMDPANRTEALREVRLDVAQGADIVMVKPALPYLDVIADVRKAVDVPVAAYQVSGEYAMIKAAAAQGLLSEASAVLEALTSIKRAGAQLIVTYYAVYASTLLAKGATESGG